MRSKFPGETFAKKSFGQNFLVDEHYIGKIISALAVQPPETIVEIGAGRGALTESLVESGANVVAVEIERDMIAVLKDKFAGKENFHLIEADALKVDYAEISAFEFQIPNSKFKLVANLPYYISTAILQKLIEQRAAFSEMILMFQREVVERITAEVGNSERGFLSVLTQNYLRAEKLFDVPPAAFRPAPKVESAVVRLTPLARNPVSDDALFRRIVSTAFLQKRKTIYNNLKNVSLDDSPETDWQKVLQTVEIKPTRRAETLTLEEWRRLYEISEGREATKA